METLSNMLEMIKQSCATLNTNIYKLNDEAFKNTKSILEDIIPKINKMVQLGHPACEAIDSVKNQCNELPKIVADYYDSLNKLSKQLKIIEKNIQNPNIHQMKTVCDDIVPLVDKLVEDSNNFKINIILMGILLINELPKSISDLHKKAGELENRLKSLDLDVFKAGLAKSFKTRECELNTPKNKWMSVLFLSLLAIPLVLALIEYKMPFDPENILVSMSVRTPVIVSINWTAWFSSKKYSYLSSIQDDYRYKYALAMAYEGYSEEVMKLNNHSELSALLLGKLIENISQNPLDHVKSGPHTPWAETLYPIIGKLDKSEN